MRIHHAAKNHGSQSSGVNAPTHTARALPNSFLLQSRCLSLGTATSISLHLWASFVRSRKKEVDPCNKKLTTWSNKSWHFKTNLCSKSLQLESKSGLNLSVSLKTSESKPKSPSNCKSKNSRMISVSFHRFSMTAYLTKEAIMVQTCFNPQRKSFRPWN